MIKVVGDPIKEEMIKVVHAISSTVSCTDSNTKNCLNIDSIDSSTKNSFNILFLTEPRKNYRKVGSKITSLTILYLFGRYIELGLNRFSSFYPSSCCPT